MRQNVIALIFGGRSTEHAVSLMSARSLHQALCTLGHSVHCVGIDSSGAWHYQGSPCTFPDKVDTSAPLVTLQPGRRSFIFSRPESAPVEITVDMIFPALHGLYGEDGALQGLSAMCGIPCVGSGILGSAVAMDKDVTKRLVGAAGIAVAPWIASFEMPTWEHVVASLGGGALFVKPACSGSSIGVARVTCESEYREAYAIAQRLDQKVLVEKEIKGREIECGILECNGQVIASQPGEVLPSKDHVFYSYDAKYATQEDSTLLVPSAISPTLALHVQNLSLDIFRCLELKGLARIDFFLRDDDEVILNEVNTLPGFTNASMYPKMLEFSGYSLELIVDALVRTALTAPLET
ncbi:D-alanine--D-alanine ligase family protein [Pseudomonas cremoricolorata]|uniref:D-alanine--D-alanine ligase family protein n=1 Tax=Pseudomonas cremoricolorata TaxID=157783 RepID=UPI00048DDBDF|nr:D-alanine--D-alanine ligase family protein [Pseudomonas cremoricolorata]